MRQAEPLLTTSDAARIADRAPDTIRQWERDGLLPAQRTVSGQRLFKRADVVAAAKARERKRDE
jgi:DNA-binding transcriptional MerR regulator